MFEAYAGKLSTLLLSSEQFMPFPKYEDRKGWQELPEEQRAAMIRQGEEYANYGWPTPLASVYMDFARNGNRTRYEDLIFGKRRAPLLALVLAECCEGKGRFIDDIINGVWSTLDEATWVIPAHNSQFIVSGESPKALPDTENPENMYIDLFSAQCAALLAWVYYTMGGRLGEESPRIPARMLGELNRRIYVPFLANKGYGWMGYHGGSVNNWNPWIISNLLTCASIACPDAEQRTAVMEKSMECLEFFVNGYAPDGGCDEGPGYWNVAGASLYDCADILYDATDGKIDLMHSELMKNICSYVYKMHISGKYFVNYADAQAIIYPTCRLLYRMGKRLKDKNLLKMGAAAYRMQQQMGMGDELLCPIYRKMKNCFAEKALAKETGSFPYVKDVWFEGIQVMAAREEEGKDTGLYLSAKGGTNGESHNHNDIGSFVLYCNGEPVFIDIGTGVYEKKTFSPQRYEILQMQSLYHNLPVIGGEGQLPGEEHKAQDVSYSCDKNSVQFGLDLRGAYPETAGIKTWKRKYIFDRKAEEMVLEDVFALENAKDVALVFMTPVRPTFTGDTMTVAAGDRARVAVSFDPSLTPEVEIFQTGHDARLRNSWGEQAYRTVFRVEKPVDAGSFRFVFRKK